MAPKPSYIKNLLSSLKSLNHSTARKRRTAKEIGFTKEGEDTETIKDLTDLENVNFTLLLQQQATIEQERRSPSLEEIHQDNADVVVTESTVEKHEFLVATPNADKSPISSETGQPHALVKLYTPSFPIKHLTAKYEAPARTSVQVRIPGVTKTKYLSTPGVTTIPREHIRRKILTEKRRLMREQVEYYPNVGDKPNAEIKENVPPPSG